MANIKLIKLLTGEDILAEVIETGDELSTDITVKNAVRVVMIPSRVDPEKPQIGLAPWAQFSDDKQVTLDKFHIVAIMTPIKEILTHYNSIFGGIVVPQSSLILPT
jgi:hypothetical protein